MVSLVEPQLTIHETSKRAGSRIDNEPQLILLNKLLDETRGGEKALEYSRFVPNHYMNLSYESCLLLQDMTPYHDQDRIHGNTVQENRRQPLRPATIHALPTSQRVTTASANLQIRGMSSRARFSCGARSRNTIPIRSSQQIRTKRTQSVVTTRGPTRDPHDTTPRGNTPRQRPHVCLPLPTIPPPLQRPSPVMLWSSAGFALRAGEDNLTSTTSSPGCSECFVAPGLSSAAFPPRGADTEAAAAAAAASAAGSIPGCSVVIF